MVLQIWIKDCLKMYKVSDEVHRRNHEKLESGIDKRKKFSWGKNQERYIPWRCAITITNGYSDDATYSGNAQVDTNFIKREQRLTT